MKLKAPNIKQLQKRFWSLPIVKDLVQWSKTHSFPGFFDVPIYDVIVFIYNELRRSDLITRANAIAFSFFLSLFPALIALFTLLPYLQNLILPYFPEGQNFGDELRKQILEIMPGNAGASLSDFINDIINNPRVGLTSLSFILAIFFASNGMMAMMRGFQKSYKTTFVKRGALVKRLVAIRMVGVLALMGVGSVLLVILGNVLLNWVFTYFEIDNFTIYTLYVLRWLVIIGLFYFGISTIYRQGASTIKKFKWFSAGATMATILSILSSVGFSFFVDNFGVYNKLYGSIGTIIVVMLWMQLNSFLILAGYELNASIAVNRDLKKVITEEVAVTSTDAVN